MLPSPLEVPEAEFGIYMPIQIAKDLDIYRSAFVTSTKQSIVECPFEKTCARGRGQSFARVMRIIQAYVLAGDMLPREPLTSEIDGFLMELETVKAKSRGMVH